jgi:hypothetical protein
MMKWIRNSRLPTKNSLSEGAHLGREALSLLLLLGLHLRPDLVLLFSVLGL